MIVILTWQSFELTKLLFCLHGPSKAKIRVCSSMTGDYNEASGGATANLILQLRVLRRTH